MKPRIKDIAEMLDLSPATVSNALNHQRGVNHETRERVLSVAKSLGYRVNEPSEALQCVRFVIYRKHGMVVMDTPFFSELIAGIDSECRVNGYELIVSHINKNTDNDYLERIKEITDGAKAPVLLLATEMDYDDIQPFLGIDVPLLVLDSYFIGLNLNTVSIENYEAGYTAASYFLKNQHRHIGFISSEPFFNNVSFRLGGLSNTLENANLTMSPHDIIAVEPTIEGSYRGMLAHLNKRNMRSYPLPTAFFAFNDIVASGSMRAFKEFGIRIPQDISIIGMDNMPMCQITDPPLTTISVFKSEMGAVAVRRLLRMANHNTRAHEIIFLGVRLIERDSVCVSIPR